jgi:hypothetical protein
VHASDAALQFAGQINQFGYMFWMLLACYAGVRAIDARRSPAGIALAAFACVFLYMSLWSYESQLPLVVLFPLLLLALRGREARRRVLLLTLSWYAVVTAYVVQVLAHYSSTGSSTYQLNVMRSDWSATALASDWWFNIVASVSFWEWAREPSSQGDQWLAALSVAVFAAGAWLMWRANASERAKIGRTSTLLTVLGVGIVTLVASFPVYLLLSTARGLWRTQLLSGIGTAVTITAAIALMTCLVGARWRVILLTTLSAVVIWSGAVAALGRGASHREGWERHREAIAGILREVPSVTPGTLVVLRDVPKARDPFGDGLWFELALKLVYHGTWVGGVYYLDDGTAPPGVALRLAYNKWFWDTKGRMSALGEPPLKSTVILTVQPSGQITLDRTLPDGLCLSECSPAEYSPEARIGRQMSKRAARRYRINGSEQDEFAR